MTCFRRAPRGGIHQPDPILDRGDVFERFRARFLVAKTARLPASMAAATSRAAGFGWAGRGMRHLTRGRHGVS
jgi:hypothetical protein